MLAVALGFCLTKTSHGRFSISVLPNQSIGEYVPEAKTPKKSGPMKLPSLRLHRPSGRAVCTINGRDIYCGKYGTNEADRRYREVLGDWLAGRPITAATAKLSPAPNEISVAELCVRYLAHSKSYYVKNGVATTEQRLVERAVKPAGDLFGLLPVSSFTPTCLRVVRDFYIAKGMSRKVVNLQTSRLRRMFRWAVANEICKPDVVVALAAVEPLKRGRTTAPENRGLHAVPDDDFEKVLKKCDLTMRVALTVQRRTGCRSGELLQMRFDLMEREGDVWNFRSPRHKSEHHGKDRVVAIGPKAIEALKLLEPATPPGAFIFRTLRSDRKGRQLTGHNYAGRLKTACERAKGHAVPPSSIASLKSD